MEIASFIEHVFLEPTTTLPDIERLCQEATQYKFAAVCVPPMFVKKAKGLVAGSNIPVATVIGFPFGYNAIESKLAETVLAIVDGADELDISINLIALKNNDWQYLAKEISTILNVTRKSNKIIKVIIHAGSLTEEELTACCDIYGAAGVGFIQLATGYSTPVTRIETLKLTRTQLANAVQVKAGDPVDPQSLKEWITAGATRIVCTDPIAAVKALTESNDGMIFENRYSNKNAE
jgi:deoxyribose-phosphate aldolase